MTSPVRRRPARDEYFEYYDTYVSLVPDGDIVTILRDQARSTLALLDDVPVEKADYRYAPGKWTLKEVVRHVIDIEWVFTLRALSFARGDSQPLPGVDQEQLAAGVDLSKCKLSDLRKELEHLRAANTILFDGLDEAVLDRTGVASGYRFTVRSIAWIIAGHEKHHMKVLSERYLGRTA